MTCIIVFFVVAGCSGQKNLEEYRTKLSSVEEEIQSNHPIETHDLSIEKREYSINERIVIFKANQPLVAFTITKVTGDIRDITDNPDFTDENNHMIDILITYENLSYSEPFDMRSTLMRNSTIKDSNNEIVDLVSSQNDNKINIGETNETVFSIKTKQLASKIDYITFEYYYPQSLLEGTYSKDDYLTIKLPVKH